MKTSTKLLLFILVLGCLLGALPAYAKSYVLPTWYGYAASERYSGVVRPYIYPYYPAYFPYYSAYTPAHYNSNYAYYPYYPYYGTAYPYYAAAIYGSSMYFPYSYNYSYWGSYFPWGATMGIVNASSLNVRSAPNKGSNRIGSFSKGEQVWIYGRNGNWFYVRSISRPHVTGYSYGNYFSVTNHYPYTYAYPGAYYPY